MKKITLRSWMVVAAGLVTLGASAQQKQTKVKHTAIPNYANHCGTTVHTERLNAATNGKYNDQQFESWLAGKVADLKARNAASKSTLNTNTVVTIPVVVHVIHDGDAVGTGENISAAQIQSQITVLNQDYSRQEGTNGWNDNPVGADMEIQFCLAQRDPNGLATTGIVRYNMGDANGFEMTEMDTTIKPATIWDPEQYLNIWVVKDIYVEVFGVQLPLAGYSAFPTMSGLDGLDGLSTEADADGVVIGSMFFGSHQIYPEGTYDETRNLGRTASHEIGHFFGLRHIWGDGDCDVDDYCEDTPVAADANSGCVAGTDSCPDSPGLDMIENYMDYTDDMCQNIFTQDQKLRMQAVLQNSPRRSTLASSLGCQPGITYDNDGSLNINAVDIAGCSTNYTIRLNLANAGNSTLTAADINYDIDGTPLTYVWTGSLAPGEETEIQIPMEGVAGSHMLNVNILTVNGGGDQTALNDTKSRAFSITDPVTAITQQITLTIQADDWGDEIAWTLTGSNGYSLSGGPYEDNYLDVQTITVEPNVCYTFTITDEYNDGICCAEGEGYYLIKTAENVELATGGDYGSGETKTFGILEEVNGVDSNKLNSVRLFPNPANTTINFEIPANMTNMPDSYTIYNSLGQVMGNGAVTAGRQSVNVAGFANGVYFVKLNGSNNSQTLQFIKY
ncbi:M43 family zinc metalloprotease [Flavobacterium sp. RHBU_3]|uniref:M43 family zinc metalloprotease n=1 Tax=Flavobacterium sp. RHBU_3 TaxID=3391184 RepID=UPI003984C112